MSEIFSCCFPCCSKKKKQKPLKTEPINNSENNNPNQSHQNNQSNINNNFPPNSAVIVPTSHVNMPVPPPPSNIRTGPLLPDIVGAPKKAFSHVLAFEIHSIIPKDSIQISDTMPEKVQRKILRYYCPLCFRYFDHMLECAKCKNYVCRFCADDIGGRPVQTWGPARCPFCDSSPYIVNDVDENEIPKKYTDTPYSSATSGFHFTGRAAGLQMKAAALAEERQKSTESPAFQRHDEKYSSVKSNGPNPFIIKDYSESPVQNKPKMLASTVPKFFQMESFALGPRILINDDKIIKRQNNEESQQNIPNYENLKIVRSNSLGDVKKYESIINPNQQEENKENMLKSNIKRKLSERSSFLRKSEYCPPMDVVAFNDLNQLAFNEMSSKKQNLHNSPEINGNNEWGRKTWDHKKNKEILNENNDLVNRSVVSDK